MPPSFPQKRITLPLLIILSFTGCAELSYQRMSDPSRDAWQKPQGVVEKLSIAPGSRVADLGAGGGYFTWHLAKAVGARGTVYAIDIEEKAINLIFKEMVARGTPNVRPVLAEPHNPRLPEPVDLVFSCDTYHLMNDRVSYFRSLASALRPGGRVAILDYILVGCFPAYLVTESKKRRSGAKWKMPVISSSTITISSIASISRFLQGMQVKKPAPPRSPTLDRTHLTPADRSRLQ